MDPNDPMNQMDPSPIRTGKYDPRSAAPALGHRSAADLALATTVAAAGVAGSLYLSIGMGLKACPLCFYQRAFAMAVLAILLVGPALRDSVKGVALATLALVPAAAGLGVAGFHVSLEMRDVLECPKGLFGVGTGPQQSLALFVLLAGVLAFATLRRAGGGVARVVLALVLGAAMTWGSIASAPPLPPKPTSAYTPDKPFDMCRPPFKP